jgi:polyhydroxyalkanoate synthase
VKGILNLVARAGRSPAVGQTPADVVHEENKWRLLRYRRPAGAPPSPTDHPVLLVPSLINRHYVLDLMPGKSFVEHLVARGLDVHIIDWGTPGPEDRWLELDEIVDRYLGRALRRSGGRAHVLGYCLGGTLAAIHAALHPERVASFVALAAPVRFHDDGLLSAWTRAPGFDPAAITSGFGNVPWPLMQGAFHLLRPTLNLSKAVHLADRAWDDEYLDGFLALETWGNDNVSFPGAAWERYVVELYRGDALARGELRVSGTRVDLARLTSPTLAVTFEHDTIVPWASAAALLDLAGAPLKERIHLPGGHVGAVVSRAASKTLWPRLVDFWTRADDAAATAPRRPARRSGAR